jgi:putative tricarboxylic transport membrane protein
MAPMILGFILGDLMERNLRRALAINDGSISFLWERPLTLTILVLTAVVLVMPAVGYLRRIRRPSTATEGEGG